MTSRYHCAKRSVQGKEGKMGFLLIVEIGYFIWGLYVLIAGRVRLSRSLNLEGRRARVVGLIMVAPLPLAFLTGLLMGALIQAGVLPTPVVRSYGTIIEILIVAGALAGILAYTRITRPKASVDAEEMETPPST
jgi:uncharacterized membrane protein YqjE